MIDQIYAKLSSRNIPALDGLRAIAVFLVIFYHFGFAQVPAGLGVLVFFVLSGFLITWLLIKENSDTDAVSLKSFYQRRALRIFPGFYVFFSIGLGYLLWKRVPIDWPHTLSAFFYVSNYYQGLRQPIDSFVSHTWSLAVEEQFYLLWPIIFVLFRNDLRKLTGVVSGLVLGIWAYRAVLQFGIGVNQAYIYRALDTRFDHLLVGCLLAISLKRRVINSVVRTVCTSRIFPAITISLLGISVYFERSTAYRDVFGFIFDPIMVAILILQLVHFSAVRPWSWINSSPMQWLGRISYSLYLYQQVSLHPARRLLARQSVPLQLFGAVAITVVLAALSHYAIERPFLKLKGRLAKAQHSDHFRHDNASAQTGDIELRKTSVTSIGAE